MFNQVFQKKKILAMHKLDIAIQEQKADVDVLSLVHLLNSFDQYYTTSSCAGRFVVLSKGSFRGKYSSKFVYKTHNPPVDLTKVREVLKEHFEGYLYINVEPPTFHIACKSLEAAIELHQLAIDSNIGYSMFKTIKKSIVVEVRGTGMLQIPIGKNNKIFVSDEYIEEIISLANEILTSEQARIKKFEFALPKKIKTSNNKQE